MNEFELNRGILSWSAIFRPTAHGRKGAVHKNDAISGEKKLLETTPFYCEFDSVVNARNAC